MNCIDASEGDCGFRPPRVLHVFPSFAAGGVQRRFAAIANRFGSRWRHIVVAMDGDVSCREALDASVEIVFPHCEMKKKDTPANVVRCRSVLRDLAPDVLVTSNWGSIEWALANTVPLVRHIHCEDGLGVDELHGQYARRVWVRRLALRRATLVVPSHSLYDVARKSWLIPKRAIALIPNGVDLDRFLPVEHKGDGPVVIGTVARLVAEKNIARLLRAFAAVRQWVAARLIVVGDGPERFALERLADALGIAADVEFAGHLAKPETAYRRFDIFALSSESEAMPLSLLEAMASGLPVASTDVGDVAKVVAAPNAPFIVPREIEALAESITSLCLSPAKRRTIGAANRTRVEAEYNQNRMFARWAALYDGAYAH